jgi:uncharacterized protein HemY
MTLKKFNNKTSQDLKITLFIRQADDLDQPSILTAFTICAGAAIEVAYGDEQDKYLNGLRLEWQDKESKTLLSKTQLITERGVSPAFDWALNTHQVLTIHDTKEMNITGSN